MVERQLLVILDGASEPRRLSHSTSLERARTPTLDALARGGSLSRLRTVPTDLPPGSETGIPVLLGWVPPRRPDRGAIEAAARGIALAPGCRAWRIDALDASGARADRPATTAAAGRLRAAVTTHDVHELSGHRLLLVGPPPLPDAAVGDGLRAWPEGVALPSALDRSCVVIAARGAAAGIARLLGARVVVPPGVTGDDTTDLGTKLAATLDALAGEATRIVVHVGGADEAAHARSPARKVAFLERVDRELMGPLVEALAGTSVTLQVCPDHGCDPVTGAHDADPVPCLRWTPAGRLPETPGPGRLTERAVAGLAIDDLTAPVGELAVSG